MRSRFSTALASVVAAAALVFAGHAKADDVADFYRGKTITIVVSVAPGGIYSNFAQTLTQHFGRHVPGNPSVIVNHMTGAGGLRANNHVFTAAPKDGTVVLTPVSELTKRAVLADPAVRYDPAEFHWLGGWGEAVSDCTVLKTAPATTLKEAMETEVIIGAFATSSVTFTRPQLINNLVGTKFKIVTGYRGGSEVRLAMERGEVHGFCGQFAGWKTAKPEWLRDGKLAHLVQLASRRSPDMPDTPLLSEFATTDEEREIFDFVQSGIEDRAMLAPPGVPEARVAALERAYMATLDDPAFRADAVKQGFEIQPVTGAEIRAFVKRIMAMSPAAIDRLREAQSPD